MLTRGGNDPAIICKDINIEEIAPKVLALNYADRGSANHPHRSLHLRSSTQDKSVWPLSVYTFTNLYTRSSVMPWLSLSKL